MKKITAFFDDPWDRNTTDTVTSVGNITKAVSLLISFSMVTINDKKITVRTTNTTDSPYSILKRRQTSEFSVVTPEQSKFNRPVDRAILSMIAEGGPGPTTYMNELLNTNKPELQNKTFWLSTPEHPGNIEDITPIQTRNIKEFLALKVESQREIEHKRWHRIWNENPWTIRLDSTLLTEAEWTSSGSHSGWIASYFCHKQNGYWDEHGVQVKTHNKVDKVVYSQNLPMPMHLKQNLIVELAPLRK